LVFSDNAKIRIIFLFNPSTLIGARDDNEKLVVVVLLNNGHGEAGADAATASVADGQYVDCVLHGEAASEGLVCGL
jgi:hypothetical protein